MVTPPDGGLADELVPEDPPPREACGVFGVWAPGEDVAKLAYYGLYALQHRGQESAGIAVSDGSRIVVHKEMGLVAQVFDEPALTALRGHIAVGQRALGFRQGEAHGGVVAQGSPRRGVGRHHWSEGAR